MNITFITGGQRSGKSRFAQELALKKSEQPIYIATARKWDADFEQRIARHQSDRGNMWQTVEKEKYISDICLNGQTALLDCITLWLTNFYTDHKFDIEKALTEAKFEWNKFINQEGELIVVSNELGMGIHPENEASRKFADAQGWMNQHIAQQANNVYLMISGIPVKIK